MSAPDIATPRPVLHYRECTPGGCRREPSVKLMCRVKMIMVLMPVLYFDVMPHDHLRSKATRDFAIIDQIVVARVIGALN